MPDVSWTADAPGADALRALAARLVTQHATDADIATLRDMFAADVRWLDHYGFGAFAQPNAATGLS